MLIGSFTHTLDAKGRVFVPAKWRDDVGDVLIVTLGLLGDENASCLFGMSVSEWELFSERLSALPMTDVAGQAVRRRLYTMAAACETDKQGRILIPAQLRETAGLTREATLIGVGNRIEFWDPEQLCRHNETADAGFTDALQHLQQLGI